MEYRILGRSNIKVSRLCYGSLTVSPSQADLSAREGGELIAYALEHGVNFIDTAQLYQTYSHIREALRQVSELPIICSKTYAWNRQTALEAVDEARRELDLDKIDIFLLHEQESVMTMHGHAEALACLLELKEQGIIGAVGLSTHAIEPVRALTEAVKHDRSGLWQEFDPGPWQEADIVHPLLNLRGIGLLDGGPEGMQTATVQAADAGLGIFGMKMYGGGHLLSDFNQAAEFALSQEHVASYAVGMQKYEEIDANIELFSKPGIDPAVCQTRSTDRRLIVSDWCTGCGPCIARCRSGALCLNDQGTVTVDHDRCTLCSYCATVCRDFVLKII